jgi:hypothetical protein
MNQQVLHKLNVDQNKPEPVNPAKKFLDCGCFAYRWNSRFGVSLISIWQFVTISRGILKRGRRSCHITFTEQMTLTRDAQPQVLTEGSVRACGRQETVVCIDAKFWAEPINEVGKGAVYWHWCIKRLIARFCAAARQGLLRAWRLQWTDVDGDSIKCDGRKLLTLTLLSFNEEREVYGQRLWCNVAIAAAAWRSSTNLIGLINSGSGINISQSFKKLTQLPHYFVHTKWRSILQPEQTLELSELLTSVSYAGLWLLKATEM